MKGRSILKIMNRSPLNFRNDVLFCTVLAFPFANTIPNNTWH